MSLALELFRETVAWSSPTATDSRYPGEADEGDPVEIPARVIDGTLQITEDVVSQVTIQVPAEYAVAIGDTLAGRKVSSIDVVKDLEGNAVFRTCYTAG